MTTQYAHFPTADREAPAVHGGEHELRVGAELRARVRGRRAVGGDRGGHLGRAAAADLGVFMVCSSIKCTLRIDVHFYQGYS